MTMRMWLVGFVLAPIVGALLTDGACTVRQSWRDEELPASRHYHELESYYTHYAHISVFITQELVNDGATSTMSTCPYNVTRHPQETMQIDWIADFNSSQPVCISGKNLSNEGRLYEIPTTNVKQVQLWTRSVNVAVLNRINRPPIQVASFSLFNETDPEYKRRVRAWGRGTDKGFRETTQFSGVCSIQLYANISSCKQYTLNMTASQSVSPSQRMLRLFRQGEMLGTKPNDSVQISVQRKSAGVDTIAVCFINPSNASVAGDYDMVIYLKNQSDLSAYHEQALVHTFTVTVSPQPMTTTKTAAATSPIPMTSPNVTLPGTTIKTPHTAASAAHTSSTGHTRAMIVASGMLTSAVTTDRHRTNISNTASPTSKDNDNGSSLGFSSLSAMQFYTVLGVSAAILLFFVILIACIVKRSIGRSGQASGDSHKKKKKRKKFLKQDSTHSCSMLMSDMRTPSTLSFPDLQPQNNQQCLNGRPLPMEPACGSPGNLYANEPVRYVDCSDISPLSFSYDTKTTLKTVTEEPVYESPTVVRKKMVGDRSTSPRDFTDEYVAMSSVAPTRSAILDTIRRTSSFGNSLDEVHEATPADDTPCPSYPPPSLPADSEQLNARVVFDTESEEKAPTPHNPVPTV